MIENPFKDVYENCNTTDLGNIPEFPYMIDIELTNYCNFTCQMCPGQQKANRPRGHMLDRTWFKLLREASKQKTPIRFVRWGEPTIHPKFVEWVGMAKTEELLVHVNTNGSTLAKPKTKMLIKRGLNMCDSVKFSFQGVDSATYFEMRRDSGFQRLMFDISAFYQTRRGEKPFVEIATTTNGEDAAEFIRTASYNSDKVSVGRTVEFGGKNEGLDPVMKCSEVFSKLSINWDGSVSACCADYDNLMVVGNLEDESLEEIWNGHKLKELRRLIATKNHRSHKLCKDCYSYIQKEG